MKKKILSISLAMILAVVAISGATLAWLIDETEPVTNTFTPSDINIALEESDDLNLQMVPGETIRKDPNVTVAANSEKCYVFLKVEKTAQLDDYIAYALHSDWKAVAGETGIYYQIVESSASAKTIPVLVAGEYSDPMGTESDSDDVTVTWQDNQVGVKPSVTKTMMENIKNGSANAALTFTAYAVQYSAVAENSPAAAWALITPTNNG